MKSHFISQQKKILPMYLQSYIFLNAIIQIFDLLLLDFDLNMYW